MAAESIRIASRCHSCVQNLPTYLHEQKFQPFPAAGSLDLITNDIPELFLKAIEKNKYTLLITDHYSKLTCTISTRGRTSTPIANLFLDHWFVLCSTFKYVLNDGDVKF